MAIEHWEMRQRQKGNIAGAEMARTLREQFGDVPLPTPEKPQKYRPFTDQEKEALRIDGATIYTLTGETIEGQRNAGRQFRYITDGGDRLLKLPSLQTEVAIYPNPRRFFIPDSGNINLAIQEELVAKDAEKLRKRLGLEGIDEVIPDEAATLTELTFQHLDKTTKEGKPVWLFGQEYASAQGLRFVYGMTKHPVNESGSLVGLVGGADHVNGVDVAGLNRDYGDDNFWVVRLVVAKKEI